MTVNDKGCIITSNDNSEELLAIRRQNRKDNQVKRKQLAAANEVNNSTVKEKSIFEISDEDEAHEETDEEISSPQNQTYM